MADFKLGRIKFKWRGNWATSTAYLIDDVIKYGGNTYVCIQNHTAPANENLFYTSPGTYTDYWSLQAESLFFKGTYADATWYKLNDLVSYGGKQYRVTTAHTSSSAVLNQANFQQYIDGVTFRGDYTENTQYRLNDIVKYGGRQYRCTTEHTSAAKVGSPATAVLNTSNFTLFIDGLDFKGDWQSSVYYKVNDVVKYGAFQYKCITAHTSSSSFATANFTVYSEGLQFEDSYDVSTVFQDGDVVTYGGYSYVFVSSTPQSGVTPVDGSVWNLLNPGFNALGNYSHGTTYKTGDVVKYGGYSMVAITDSTSERPFTTGTATVDGKWKTLSQGFEWKGSYNAGTTYLIGEVVEYSSSSYVAVVDIILGVTPGTDAAKWQLLAQGSTNNVLTTRGDIVVRDVTQTTRLPIGVAGSILTTDGTDVLWSNAEVANVKWVSNSGSDSNPGTQTLPYKTINYALKQTTSGDIIEIENIAGGSGGTPGTYDVVQASSTGSGTGFAARVILDGTSTPLVTITDGGTGHAEGDTITISGVGSPTASTNITLDAKSVSVGDVLYVKNGVYKENLPMQVPAGVTLRGESLRGTEVQPASGTGTQIATVTQSGGVGGTAGTYNYVHQTSTSGTGNGIVVNVVQDGSSAPTVTVYHGGYHYAVADTITIAAANIGNPGSALTLTVASLENNNASNMLLVNNQTNVTLFTFKGLTGTPTGGGVSTQNPAVVSLDPEGAILTASPYIQDCTSINAGATGIQIDGNLHANLGTSGNKSILANDFTQINSDGVGVHAIGTGRGEMVSVFTYYCDKSYFAESGGFIRGLNCSSAYGEQGAVADGSAVDETSVVVQTRGEQLLYQPATISTASTSDIAGAITTNGSGTATVTGNTSGATATFFRYQVSKDTLYIENRTGNFQQGETITITKEDSSTFTVDLSASVGDSSAAQIGQINALIAIKSTDGTLSSATAIPVGANIRFAGDSTYFRVGAVTETNTLNETALVRLTLALGSGEAVAEGTTTTVTNEFSNVRLTGHDFLDIGTGGFADTNYPDAVGATQAPEQDDEVTETNGGRVYFSSTDQNGDFRVGDLFRIQQATGTATLNADAFDLSGLSELQLGSIGAEIGATINEFSTDETLGGNSTESVPTERAVLGYLTRDKAGTGAWVPPTGTTAQRPTGGALYTGAIRYNETLVTWEGYNGTQWTGLGGGNPWASIDNTDSPYAIAANDRVFVDTSGGAVTVTLPGSPLTGDQIRVLDLAATFDTNNLTLARNGLKIMGDTADLVVSTENASIGLVYTGATYGWKLIENF
jgi:hypothetical protein